VNYVEILGGATGTGGRFFAAGSDTNIVLDYVTKGTSAHNFYTGATSAIQFKVANTASAVNFLQVTGSASTFPTLSAQGSSTNVAIVYTTKGTEPHYFQTNSAAATQFAVAHRASAVNYFQVTGGVTTGAPILSAQGSDTNINILLLSKGTGGHVFTTGSSSNTQFAVAHTASAVNYLQVTGAATGVQSVLSVQGSDTNAGITFLAKGTGSNIHYANSHIFANTSAATQFIVQNTASTVNYVQATGAATGNGVTLSAQGSDTNIDLALTPKGTGVLAFGTHTAGIVAQAGYITVKDAGGTTRRLLVG